MPLSVMDGLPWWVSLFCQDFKPLCSFLGWQKETFLSLVSHNLVLLSWCKPDLQSIDSGHGVAFDVNTSFILVTKTYAAAAAKSLQSCSILCDPIDGSPPGSPVPGILQARTLDWVAISFSNTWKWKVKVKLLSKCATLHDPMDCSLPGSSLTNKGDRPLGMLNNSTKSGINISGWPQKRDN